MSKKLYDIFNFKKNDVLSTHDFKPALSELNSSATHTDTEKQSNEELNITNNLKCNKILKSDLGTKETWPVRPLLKVGYLFEYL